MRLDKIVDNEWPLGNRPIGINAAEVVIPTNKPSIDAVDALADELVAEYANPTYRKWYCGVIYEYGTAQVEEWRKRSREGKAPGKLFTVYVNQARTRRRRPPQGGGSG